METKKVNEEKLKSEFAASRDLQLEFGNDVEAYIAFKQADAEGRAILCTGRGVTGFSSAPAPKTEPVRSAFAEAAARAEEISRDEERQYLSGTPCQA